MSCQCTSACTAVTRSGDAGRKLASERKTGKILAEKVLECKTAGERNADQFGEAGTDQVPDYYLVQLAQYLMLTGCAQGDLAVLIGNGDFRVYTIRRDAELEEMMIARAREFWERHIVADIAPEPANLADVRKLFPADTGSEKEATAEIAAKVEQLRLVRGQLEPIAAEEERLEGDIKTFLAEAATLTVMGRPVVTWKSSKASKRFHSAVFKAENAELYDAYCRETPGARRFLLKG